MAIEVIFCILCNSFIGKLLYFFSDTPVIIKESALLNTLLGSYLVLMIITSMHREKSDLFAA